MSEEKKTTEKNTEPKPEVKNAADFKVEEKRGAGTAEAKPKPDSPGKFSGGRSSDGGRRKGKGRKRSREREEKRDEFEQRVLDVARVTRVMAGGKRMSFRVCVAIGDKKSKVGVGLGKGADVAMAVNKAVNKAKKNLIEVSTVKETIPHEIYCKLGAAKILFKPARRGRGVIAGGVVRIILELAGVRNVSSKILGTNNKINNAKCTIEALKKLKRVEIKSRGEKDDNEKKNPKTEVQTENQGQK